MVEYKSGLRRASRQEKSTYVKEANIVRVIVGHKNKAESKCHSLFIGDIAPSMLVLRCLWLVVSLAGLTSRG